MNGQGLSMVGGRRRLGVWALVLAAVAVAGSGCTGLRDPEAGVADALVAERSLEGARLSVTVEVANPNSVTLPVTRVHYTVRVENAGTFEFTEKPPVALTPGATTRIVLPAVLGVEGGSLLGRPYQVSGTLTYQPPGEMREVLTETGVPLPSISFSGSGVLN